MATVKSKYLPEDLFIEVFARQEEMIGLIHGTTLMSSSTPQRKSKTQQKLKTDKDGRIDCTDFSNVHSMLNLILDTALQYQKDKLSVEECIKQIRKYLNKPIHFKEKTGGHDFLIGIQGFSLFGMHSPKIGRHIMARQSLIGGTNWWRFDVANKSGKLVRLNSEELASAYQWVINRERSRISFKSGWW